MRTTITIFAAMAALVLAMAVHAHSGGLDKQGCHNNSKTGDYHCHRGGTLPATPSPLPAQGLAPAVPAGRSPVRSTPYRNCTEARAAGAAPVKRGQAGYGPHLDRDDDGIGCE